MFGELLHNVPDDVDDALDIVAGFDATLVHGLARLGQRATALTALAGTVATSPLEKRVGVAVDSIVAGSVDETHLIALAAGRTAIMGSVHDALLAHFDTSLGRERTTPEPMPSMPAADHLLAACRSWLCELAITGWNGVDHDLVSAAHHTIAAAIAEPGLRRAAVLLDGFAAELGASCPVATMDRIPERRWADMWSRALVLTQMGRWAHVGETVSGRLLILGVDVHEHGTAVQVQVHGILESPGAKPRLVRTSVAAAKVDTIVGPAIWRLMSTHVVLLRALAEHRSIQVSDVTLLPSGDLHWDDERVAAGEPADPFATARVMLPTAIAAGVPPLERHPVRISEPVLIEAYQTSVADDGRVMIQLDGHAIPVDTKRLPRSGPLTRSLVAGSSACIALMRWDGGTWSLQPLAVQATVKRKKIDAHNGDWALGPTDPKVAKAETASGDAVAVLRERAGRLLRR